MDLYQQIEQLEGEIKELDDDKDHFRRLSDLVDFFPGGFRAVLPSVQRLDDNLRRHSQLRLQFVPVQELMLFSALSYALFFDGTRAVELFELVCSYIERNSANFAELADVHVKYLQPLLARLSGHQHSNLILSAVAEIFNLRIYVLDVSLGAYFVCALHEQTHQYIRTARAYTGQRSLRLDVVKEPRGEPRKVALLRLGNVPEIGTSFDAIFPIERVQPAESAISSQGGHGMDTKVQFMGEFHELSDLLVPGGVLVPDDDGCRLVAEKLGGGRYSIYRLHPRTGVKEFVKEVVVLGYTSLRPAKPPAKLALPLPLPKYSLDKQQLGVILRSSKPQPAANQPAPLHESEALQVAVVNAAELAPQLHVTAETFDLSELLFSGNANALMASIQKGGAASISLLAAATRSLVDKLRRLSHGGTKEEVELESLGGTVERVQALVKLAEDGAPTFPVMGPENAGKSTLCSAIIREMTKGVTFQVDKPPSAAVAVRLPAPKMAAGHGGLPPDFYVCTFVLADQDGSRLPPEMFCARLQVADDNLFLSKYKSFDFGALNVLPSGKSGTTTMLCTVVDLLPHETQPRLEFDCHGAHYISELLEHVKAIQDFDYDAFEAQELHVARPDGMLCNCSIACLTSHPAGVAEQDGDEVSSEPCEAMRPPEDADFWADAAIAVFGEKKLDPGVVDHRQRIIVRSYTDDDLKLPSDRREWIGKKVIIYFPQTSMAELLPAVRQTLLRFTVRSDWARAGLIKGFPTLKLPSRLRARLVDVPGFKADAMTAYYQKLQSAALRELAFSSLVYCVPPRLDIRVPAAMLNSMVADRCGSPR